MGTVKYQDSTIVYNTMPKATTRRVSIKLEYSPRKLRELEADRRVGAINTDGYYIYTDVPADHELVTSVSDEALTTFDQR